MTNKILLALACITLVGIMPSLLWAKATPLANSDCNKCHDEIVTDVKQNGGKHQSMVACLDCHREHPPKGQEVIPECSLCHSPEAKDHYATKECLPCHNPHHPLDIDLSKTDSVKKVCVTCHSAQGQQLQDYPSKHTSLDCSACHQQHGQFLRCSSCHGPHTEGQTYKDCLTCHKPHKPTVVRYPENLPNKHCAGCHDKAAQDLAQNTTKHHDLQCAYCHKTQHKAIPTCETCHGKPHEKAMHKTFPDCLKCHIDPHALAK